MQAIRKVTNYKQYTVTAIAPSNTVVVRARASMIGAMSNPMGGGQAFVADDFSLTVQAIAQPRITSISMFLLKSVFKEWGLSDIPPWRW